MKKIIVFGIMILMSCWINSHAEESEKDKAWKNDDPAYISFMGENINVGDEYKDQTALHWAASWGKYNIAKALIEKGAKVNIKDYIDETPLHKVSGMGAITQEDKQAHYKTAQLLIEHGAKINARGGRNATAADNLFKAGGKLNRTPLHLACNNGGNFEIVKLLVEHGADVNAKDYENCSPLLFAVDQKNYEIVEYLLSKGVDVNNISKSYYTSPTPIFKAVSNENLKLAGLLIKYGANLNQKNSEGETPYQFAVSTGRKQMADFLKKAEEKQAQKSKVK